MSAWTIIFRLESEYDNLEEPNSDSTRAPPEVSLSPDSDNGDIYENLPTVIKQGQQVHSDGLTMQSINIQGPKARFDGSFDGTSQPAQQSWDLLQGSLNFAYGPPSNQEKQDTSDYTSLKELAPAKHPVVPARTVSTVKHSSSQHSIASTSHQQDPNRYQTDVWANRAYCCTAGYLIFEIVCWWSHGDAWHTDYRRERNWKRTNCWLAWWYC